MLECSVEAATYRNRQDISPGNGRLPEVASQFFLYREIPVDVLHQGSPARNLRKLTGLLPSISRTDQAPIQ